MARFSKKTFIEYIEQAIIDTNDENAYNQDKEAQSRKQGALHVLNLMIEITKKDSNLKLRKLLNQLNAASNVLQKEYKFGHDKDLEQIKGKGEKLNKAYGYFDTIEAIIIDILMDNI